jgi:membrane associated rhomboid family serine protease
VLIPLRDSNPTRHFPIVTVVIIALNVLVFAYEITRPTATLPSYPEGIPVQVSGFDEVTAEWGFVPCEVQDTCDHENVTVLPAAGRSDVGYQVQVPDHPVWQTVFTAMFLHGGWLHIAGNMLFLWIFGNNVEDSMGRPRFVVFYLLCGVLATLTQWLTDVGSNVPNIGASGAIAGVLGGYLLLYPRAKVTTLLFLVVFFTWLQIPAWVVLGFWFVLQLADSSVGGAGGGGVAYFAHVGGFVAGLALIRVFAKQMPRPPTPPRQRELTWF